MKHHEESTFINVDRRNIEKLYGTYGTVLQTSPEMSQDSSHVAEMLLLVTLKAVAISGMLGWY